MDKDERCMKHFLIKYKTAIELILTFLESIILGIYLAIVSGNIIDGDSFFYAFFKTKGSWFYILVAVILFILQLYLSISSSREMSSKKKDIINSILQVACRSLIYPHNYHIRAIITECDYKKNTRKTTFGYNIGISPERFAEYAINFGVTGKAFSAKRPIAEVLPTDHISTYDSHHQAIVEERLKCVLAAPIFKSAEDNTVIGILAFDSIEPINKMKFDTDASKELAQNWADIISNILKY